MASWAEARLPNETRAQRKAKESCMVVRVGGGSEMGEVSKKCDGFSKGEHN